MELTTSHIVTALAFLIAANIVLFIACRRKNRRIYQSKQDASLRAWLDRHPHQPRNQHYRDEPDELESNMERDRR